MTVLFYINESLVNFDDPTVLVKKEYSAKLALKERAPYILSELCVLDMIYAVADMKGGYYRDRLVLKGGLSVRNHVELLDHRFSFDVDYDPNTQSGFTFGKVDMIRRDLIEYSNRRGCRTYIKEARDTARDYFLELGYRRPIVDMGGELVEVPMLELCKSCRVFQKPQRGTMKTFIDLDLLGLKPPEVYHVGLEEQLATKLFIIGASGRQRNQFDAYDAMMIVEDNSKKLDWRVARDIFEEKVLRHNAKFGPYVEECRHQLDAMLRNPGKRSKLQDTAFHPDFSFDRMVETVKSMYAFKG